MTRDVVYDQKLVVQQQLRHLASQRIAVSAIASSEYGCLAPPGVGHAVITNGHIWMADAGGQVLVCDPDTSKLREEPPRQPMARMFGNCVALASEGWPRDLRLQAWRRMVLQLLYDCGFRGLR